MKNILVTGGAGYIGSHACKALAHSGYQPVCFDNLSRGHRWAVQWGPLVEADLLDREALAAAMAEYQPEAVIHFAAMAYVGESISRPADYYQNNVQGSLNLLQAMIDADVRKLVFSSTCAVYGEAESVPIQEHHRCQPVNPYGNTKLTVERALADYHQAYGLRSVSLRYFNAAGADPDGEVGEAHDPETHLIPLALKAADGELDALRIFGTDYPTPDGTCVRDYIHVTDLVVAHLAALDWVAEHDQAARFNLGTGRGYSVREIIDTVSAVTGTEVPVIESPRRDGDPASLVAAAGAAAQVLNWQPRYTDIREIVETAWHWHQSSKRS